MNYLTAIRKAIRELKIAYDNAQKEDKIVEAQINCVAAKNLIDIAIREMQKDKPRPTMNITHSIKCLNSGSIKCEKECPKNTLTKEPCIACDASSESIDRVIIEGQSHCLDARQCANRQQF